MPEQNVKSHLYECVFILKLLPGWSELKQSADEKQTCHNRWVLEPEGPVDSCVPGKHTVRDSSFILCWLIFVTYF